MKRRANCIQIHGDGEIRATSNQFGRLSDQTNLSRGHEEGQAVGPYIVGNTMGEEIEQGFRVPTHTRYYYYWILAETNSQ
jgi:hypothetical protein